MNADFLAVLEFWEREKGISRDILVSAVQEALVSAAKKAIGDRKSTRLNSSHLKLSRMPSSA